MDYSWNEGILMKIFNFLLSYKMILPSTELPIKIGNLIKIQQLLSTLYP